MTLRGQPGPYGAPYDDGSDPRWSDDFLAIVQPHPELLEYALGLLSAGWDMGGRAKPGPPPAVGNPFWGLDTEAADARIRSTQPAPPPKGLLMDTDRVELPPKLRIVLYYVLGVLNAANVAAFIVLGNDNKWLLAGQVFLSALSALFFGVAGSNVRQAAPEYDARHD